MHFRSQVTLKLQIKHPIVSDHRDEEIGADYRSTPRACQNRWEWRLRPADLLFRKGRKEEVLQAGNEILEPKRRLPQAVRQAEEAYRRYRIVAGQRGHKFMAVAYAGRSCKFSVDRANAIEAVDAIKSLIDVDYAQRSEARRGPISDDEMLFALELTSDRHTAAINHVLDWVVRYGDGPASLAVIGNSSDLTTVQLARGLGKLAKDIAEILELSDHGPEAGSNNLGLLIDPVPEHLERDSGWHFTQPFVDAARRLR